MAGCDYRILGGDIAIGLNSKLEIGNKRMGNL